MSATIVRVIYENVTYDLEVQEDIPLRLDVSAIESQDIGKFTGVGSQQFILPGTKVNNRFFKHAYMVGADDVPAFYNSIQGYILYRGETVLSGQFQLVDVVTDQDGYTTYSCIIQDSSVQFKDSIQSQLLIDGDWDAYNHTLSVDNIISSWNDGLFSGSIFYPVVDYGIDQPTDFPAIPRVQLGSITSPNPGDINSTDTPLRLKQFLPAIKARDVLDVIFETAGFVATGSFMESQDFNSTYILPKASEQLGIAGTTGSLQTFSAIPTANYLISPNPVYAGSSVRQFYAGFGQESYDYGNNLTTTTSGGGQPITKYTAPLSGKYTFETQLTLSNGVTAGNNADYKVWICNSRIGACNFYNTSSAFYPVEQQVVSTDPSQITLSTGGEMDLLTGDEIYVMFGFQGNKVIGGNLLVNPITLFKQGSNWTATQAPITYENAPVSMSLQFDQSTKSIDVVKGLIEQFNLVFTAVPEDNKLIQVETFDEWMWQGRNVDWTDKYNTAERVQISHTVDEQNRELLLSNEEDVDRFSVVAKDNAPNYQYGTLRLLSDSNIPQGSKKIGSYFGPTVLAGQVTSGSVDESGNTFNINTNSTFVFPHLYKFDNRQQKSIKFRPRLGYKVSNSLPIATNGQQYTFNLGLPGTEGVDYRVVSGSYTTLSNVDILPVVAGTNDLHNNNSYTTFGSAGLNLQGGINNYSRYWQNYIDSLYWSGARKLTLDLKFNAEEYRDIRLNDHIFIKDQQYRINKISGFNLSYKDVVTVELIRLFPAYYTSPVSFDCAFTVTGSYSDDDCGAPVPVPIPQPVPAPTTVPQPVPAPTVVPQPVPQPVPVPAPAACTEWELFCPSTTVGNCTFDVNCCDGSTQTNVSVLPDATCYYCATNATVVGLYGSVTNTAFGCSDDCFIGCQ